MLRPNYLAGKWYPSAPGACAAAVESHAADVQPEQGDWRGIISPHAGWTYSGNAAGQAFRWLGEARSDADLVVFFGAHRGEQGPNTIFLGEGWDTPLGPMANATELAARLATLLQFDEEPVEPQHPDNAVEVQLPFARFFFPKAQLLMLGVEASPRAIEVGKQVAEVVRDAGRDAIFVGSTDLTHYGANYGFQPKGHGAQAVDWVRNNNDRGFLDLLLAEKLDDAVAHARQQSSACCPGAVVASMAAVRAFGGGGTAQLIDHYLSYDVYPADSFVGYAGIVL